MKFSLSGMNSDQILTEKGYQKIEDNSWIRPTDHQRRFHAIIVADDIVDLHQDLPATNTAYGHRSVNKGMFVKMEILRILK